MKDWLSFLQQRKQPTFSTGTFFPRSKKNQKQKQEEIKQHPLIYKHHILSYQSTLRDCAHDEFICWQQLNSVWYLCRWVKGLHTCNISPGSGRAPYLEVGGITVWDHKIQTRKKGRKECYLLGQKTHNLQILGVIPSVKLHIDTYLLSV